MKVGRIFTAIFLMIFLATPVQANDTRPGTPRVDTQTSEMNYIPGLGEFMSVIQMHHAKLWYSGHDENWPLAAYELDELKEGFEDAAKYQPDFKGRPIAKMIESIIIAPLSAVNRSIEARDPDQFKAAFDKLSTACSSCHQAAGYDFINIQRPTLPTLTNQRFKPKP